MSQQSSATPPSTSTESTNSTSSLYFPVQTKISCLFEIEFLEKEKKVLAVNRLYKKVANLPSDTNVRVNPTIKIDGTCCLIRQGKLFKRYDRKLNTSGAKKNKQFQKEISQGSADTSILQFDISKDFKEGPKGWIPCDSIAHLFVDDESVPQVVSSQHLVGWVPVDSNDASDKWHCSAIVQINNEPHAIMLSPYFDQNDEQAKFSVEFRKLSSLENQTVELIGSKINGNVYNFPANEKQHFLVPHGWASFSWNANNIFLENIKELTVENLKSWFEDESNLMSKSEGIVFHIMYKTEEGHDKEMLIKIHRHHLNLDWPLKGSVTPQFQYQLKWIEDVLRLKSENKI